MKIATWNVNSIRTRINHVIDWLSEHPVDVLCLQETKVVDPDFPRTPFTDLDYHVHVFGQKAYNGVALISRLALTEVQMGFTPVLAAAGMAVDAAATFDEQKRVITGVVDDIRIVNLYVPNGSAVGSDKYDYKLRWFQVLEQYLKTLLATDPSNVLICGDFNIALEDRDIYKPEGRAKHIMASDRERAALQTILDLGFTDAFRKFTDDEGHFSWWDYRAASFRRNMGWRIDHHYLTPQLDERALSCTIDKTPRGWEKPSDHAPVTVELSP